MKKFVNLFSFLCLCFFGFSTFAASTVTVTSTSKTFIESVAQEKTIIETMFDSGYTAVYKQFQTSVGGLLSSLNYQGLVCLGVIDDTILLQQMQNDNRNLKLGFLNAYATIYADALDIEQKQRIYQDTSVSLFASGSTYETEKNRILASLTQLSVNQKKLAEQFQQTYDAKIKKFVADYYAYAEKNKDLLTTVTTRITAMQAVDQQYKKLTSDLLSYQSKLAGSGASFFNKLYYVKESSLSGLDVTLQNAIAKEVKKYKVLPTLSTELSQQKVYALGLFGLQIDEKINLLLAQWYDNKEFTQITKEVEQLSSTYAPQGRPVCSSLMAATSFTENVQNLSRKITNFSQTISLVKTGSTTGFQEKIKTWFPVVTQLQKDMLVSFTKTIQQKEKVLLEALRKEREQSSSQTQPLPTQTQPSSSATGGNLPISADGFSFTKAFKKGELHKDIKVLQNLLTSLGYYSGTVDGVYSSQTIQAVYQYQLAKNLLKGYEKRPQTWGWMGPATRTQLNKDLIQ